MKTFFFVFVYGVLCVVNARAFAAVSSVEKIDLLRTARAVNFAKDRKFDVGTILEVSRSNRLSVPPLNCIEITTTKVKNSICPDDPRVGEYFRSGVAVCFALESTEPIAADGFYQECIDLPDASLIAP